MGKSEDRIAELEAENERLRLDKIDATVDMRMATQRIVKLQAEVDRLREYEYMYEGLRK